MAKPTKQEVKSIVKPTVSFNDSKEHVLATLLAENSAPVIESVGVFKVPNTNRYVSFVMKTQGKEVISIEVNEPDLRAIAEEAAKISFVDKFMSGDLE